jgi:4-hydroxy-tetrahydrodipicolinate synthase
MFAGALTALVTPFRDDRIDEKALRALVAEQIANGISGLVVSGTTGECASLSHEEYAQLLAIVIDEAKGRVPVVAGAGTASTAHSIELGRIARKHKADALLVVVPYYYRPSQEGLYAHFSAIAKAVPLPLVLYNIPVRTGMDLAVSTLERLASVSNIVAIKESTGNVLRASEIVARFGERFSVLSGDDSLTLPMMAVGGSGVISTTSNVVPQKISKLVELFRSGDVQGARKLHHHLAPLFEALFIESNPGPVKFAMGVRGMMSSEIRLPFVQPTEASQQRIRKALSDVGVS